MLWSNEWYMKNCLCNGLFTATLSFTITTLNLEKIRNKMFRLPDPFVHDRVVVKPNRQLRVVVDGDSLSESHSGHRAPDEVRRRIVDLVPAARHRSGTARTFPGNFQTKKMFSDLLNSFYSIHIFFYKKSNTWKKDVMLIVHPTQPSC